MHVKQKLGPENSTWKNALFFRKTQFLFFAVFIFEYILGLVIEKVNLDYELTGLFAKVYSWKLDTPIMNANNDSFLTGLKDWSEISRIVSYYPIEPSFT